jgi:exonuclease SbcC
LIDSISIQNFQSHKKTELQFDPGVNIIIGSSDCGKTSIVRALNWIVNNRPLGDSFRSVWGGDTKTELQLNHHVIERFKTADNKNFYRFDYNDENLFGAFNKDVPEEVKQLLNFTDINLQKQLDAPFLLCKTPGEVQRILNRIAHLDKIDEAMKQIESTKRKVNDDLENAKTDIDGMNRSLKKYEGLEKLEKRIAELKNIEDEKEALKETKHPKLISLLADISLSEEKISKLEYITYFEPKVIELYNENEELKKKQLYVGNLKSVMSTIKYIDIQKSELEKTCKQKENIEFILKVIEEKKVIKERQRKLQIVLDELSDNIEQIYNLQKEIDEDEKIFNKEFPNICPLCGKAKE